MMARLSTEGIGTISNSGASEPRQTSSADIIASNDDLLTQILLLLPIRSLLKFKCVSKHWLSLISNPHFSNSRSPHPTPIAGLFLQKSSSPDGQDYQFVPFKGKPSRAFPNLPAWISVLQSCNGLLCCYRNQNNEAKRNYYIYNPTTHHVTVLPELGTLSFRAVAGVILAFDPSRSLHYKVVCVRRVDHSQNRYWIEIYSSETGTWRVSGDAFTTVYNVKFDAGVFWNGAVHWIGNMVRTMMSFDVDEERLRETPMPGLENLKQRTLYFGESQGHLHIILPEDYGRIPVNIYEMEKDYSRWFVKYQVDIEVVGAAFPEMRGRNWWEPLSLYYSVSTLYLVREENDDESFLVLQVRGKAVCYSFKDKTFKKLCDVALSCAGFGWQCAHPYIESLACV